MSEKGRIYIYEWLQLGVVVVGVWGGGGWDLWGASKKVPAFSMRALTLAGEGTDPLQSLELDGQLRHPRGSPRAQRPKDN